MAVQRWGLSPDEQAFVWALWAAGESSDAIGAAVGRDRGSVYYLVKGRGGIPPRVRHRATRALRPEEREEISRGLAAQESLRSIATRLGRPASTISREIGRNGGPTGYRAGKADRAAWTRARRPKPLRLEGDRRLRRLVEKKLRTHWSPQQIAAWLMETYPDDPTRHVSHEAIYRALYLQARGALKAGLTAYLRRRRTFRQPRAATRRTRGVGQLRDIVSIADRPPSADGRAIPGHWEGDLLMGKKGTQIATLVERQSRFVLLVRVPQPDAATVAQALARRVQRLPAALKQSLTWDRGKEMAQHQAFKIATDVQVYFCDPHSPWQRGSNENTNGLLRQYFPKGTDFSGITQRQLNAVALELNTRPRQTLGWKTPAAVLDAAVASTV